MVGRPEQLVSAYARALQILEARKVDDVAVATARTLATCVQATAVYVAIGDRHGNWSIRACEGDARCARAIGEPLREGLEQTLTGTDPVQVPNPGQLSGVRSATAPGGGRLVAWAAHVGERAVAVVLLPSDASADAVSSVGAIVAVSRVAFGHARAFEDARSVAARQEALLDLQRIVGGALLEDAFPSFATRLAEEVSFDHAFVAAVSPAMDELLLVATHPSNAIAPGTGETIALAPETPLGRVLQTGRERGGGPSFLAGAEAGHLAPWAASAAVLPLVAQDAVVGVLVLLSKAPHLSPDGLKSDARWLLAAVVETLGMALQNAALFGRLRATLRDWQTTFDVMDTAAFVAEDDGKVRRANWALAKRLGQSPGALRGRPIDALFPGQPLPSVREAPRTSLTGRGGEPLRASAVALPGGGTVVVIQEVREGTGPQRPQSHAALRRIATGNPAPLRGRVLVVDDEPSIVRAVLRMLSRDHDVVAAKDGEEGLRAIRGAAQPFDVVMTDIQMPRMNGLDLFRAIEREFPGLSQHVLFMTGGIFNADVEGFLKSLRSRVLRKPFDPDVLRRRVDDQIALARVR